VGVGPDQIEHGKIYVSLLARVVLLSLRVSWNHHADNIRMIALSAAASVGCKKGVAAPMAGGRQQKDRAQTGDAAPECYPAKARGLGGKGIDRIFFQCGDAAPGSRLFDSKRRAQRGRLEIRRGVCERCAAAYTLLPSHTAYKIQILSEPTREGAVEDAIFGVGKFRMLDWMGSEFGPLPRRHCGKGQRRSRALSIDPFFSPDCSRSAWGAAADSLMRSAARGFP
jgi:hypothetical protein